MLPVCRMEGRPRGSSSPIRQKTTKADLNRPVAAGTSICSKAGGRAAHSLCWMSGIKVWAMWCRAPHSCGSRLCHSQEVPWGGGGSHLFQVPRIANRGSHNDLSQGQARWVHQAFRLKPPEGSRIGSDASATDAKVLTSWWIKGP